jgi:hypothetical protein
LGIEVHQENAATLTVESNTQIEGRRCLANAALLVRDRRDHRAGRAAVVKQLPDRFL